MEGQHTLFIVVHRLRLSVHKANVFLMLSISKRTLELESIQEAINALPGDCLLVGDFDSDLQLPDKAPQDGQTLLDLLDVYTLHNLIDSPTRITKTSTS